MHAKARPVLLAYDGSIDAKHAIATAGELVGGHAVVVHVYATPKPAVAATPASGIALTVDPALTAEVEQRAREKAGARGRRGR